jgi:hypothetical protein
MDESTASPKPEPTPIQQRSEQLRALWQALPAFVSAFAPRRIAAR